MTFVRKVIFISVAVVLIAAMTLMTACKGGAKTGEAVTKASETTKATSAQETAETANISQTTLSTSESIISNESPQTSETNKIYEDGVLISPIAVLTVDYEYSNIILTNSKGKLLRKITEDNYSNLAPELSPDANKIVFYSNRDGDFDIYSVKIDGTDLKNITNNNSQDYMPKWSYNGKKICYYSDETGDTDVYIINEDGTQNKQVVNNDAENYGAIWSYDDSKIFYVSNEGGNFDIYSIGIDGSKKIKLTSDEYFEESLSLSPDGSKILYSSGQIDNTVFEVFVLDLNNMETNQLTNNMSYGRMPLWVQEGNKIIFSSDMEGYSEIYIMDTDGTKVLNLTNNGIDDYLINISKDGYNIFYEAFKEEDEAEFLMYDLKNSSIIKIMEIKSETAG